jgi:hypothetical protein
MMAFRGRTIPTLYQDIVVGILLKSAKRLSVK